MPKMETVIQAQKGNKFIVKWKKASFTDGYYVYAQCCGKKVKLGKSTVR